MADRPLQAIVTELRALEAKATPAPWRNATGQIAEEVERQANTFGDETGMVSDSMPSDTLAHIVIGTIWYDGHHLCLRETDAVLIAAARNALVDLLTAAEDRDRLAARVAELETLVTGLSAYTTTEDGRLCGPYCYQCDASVERCDSADHACLGQHARAVMRRPT